LFIVDRREFLALCAATSIAGRSGWAAELKRAAADDDRTAQWIWYPGQLAAHRQARRVLRSMERCAKVGYPGNFRQPLPFAAFRMKRSAARDIAVRWSASPGRVRTLLGGVGADVTLRSGIFRSGHQNIEVQIDFALGLPCLWLDGEEFSTGPDWEASLDGVQWTPAETWAGGEISRLPDAEREIVVSYPVAETVQPKGNPQQSYWLRPGENLLVDFRQTELGSLRFDAAGSGQLHVQVGESAAEASDPDVSDFEQAPLPVTLVTREPARIALPERALRFARFSATGAARITNIRFDAKLWPAQERGQFESSDAGLNGIWRTAVATLRSNMHDFYLDGIKRDGLVWHDGTLTLEAFERVFFDADLSRQTLIVQTLPQNPSLHDVGILDGPLYGVLGFEREYMLRGDAGFSRMFRDRIEGILRFYQALQDRNGFVDARTVEPYGFFPDWSAAEQSGPDSHGTPAYAQMLLAEAFAAGSRLAQAWGDSDAEARYRDEAQRIQKAIRAAFWNAEAGLFVNGMDRHGDMDRRYTSFAQAFAVRFGIAQESEFDGLFRFLNDFKRRPEHFSLSQVVELAAYAQAGRAAEAVARLKSAWLPLIQQGYHRFFEDIDQEKPASAQLGMYGRKYAASLCHAWAGAAPVLAISKGVLGIEPAAPGFRECTVRPQRCGLAWFRGAVPTPQGPIEVEGKAGGGVLTLPTGVRARLIDGRVLKGPGRFNLPLA
jgi:hypothetical protein